MGSAGFGHTSKLLHKMFGVKILGNIKKRNELQGIVNNDPTLIGDKYFDVIDGKIVDKKTNKEYEKTDEGLKEGVKDMKLEIQNALMKNKKFREKVKEVEIR